MKLCATKHDGDPFGDSKEQPLVNGNLGGQSWFCEL